MVGQFDDFFGNARPGRVRKLEPYAALIRHCRRQRWSFRRIIAELKRQKQIVVPHTTLWKFLRSQKPASPRQSPGKGAAANGPRAHFRSPRPRLCRLSNHCRPRRPRHQPKPCLPHLCCHASRDTMTFDYAGLAVPALPGFSWCHRCNQTVPPFSMTDSTIQLFLGPPGLSFAKRAGATLYSSTSRGCSP